ncbi:Uncharacterized protein SCF082_LOCUS48774 [Durusdinium trenchii]|uniref:EF-hand domain-containing protein n=1 Tax=Durusdinium trenchii TaxID=1381693 RepID=A0ABP0RX45_9DINO
MFGAHGDGLSWSVFMGAGSALLEAVPAREAGFQAPSVEGMNSNPFGIFGGVARLANVAHFCFLNDASQVLAFQSDEKDLFQWGWRQLNLHIDLLKFRRLLSVPSRVLTPLGDTVEHIQDGPPVSSQSEAARAFVTKFLTKKEGSVLRAWMQRLDPEWERTVTEQRFMRYMRDIRCPRDSIALFGQLDADGGGELSLQELDEDAALLFYRFQEFCVAKFRRGVEEFMRNVGECDAWDPYDEVNITFEQFQTALQSHGWHYGQEEELFDALSSDKEYIRAEDMKWLGVELRRFLRKEKARQMALQEQRLKERKSVIDPNKSLLELKLMLKRKFGGSLVRAWRRVFANRETLSMQKPQFVKACAELGWRKDVRSMWYLLDKDNNGCVTLEEFDYDGAQALARFSKFLMQNYKSAEMAFRMLDVDGNLYVPRDEFIAAAGRMGFESSAPLLFTAFDLNNAGRIYEEDMRFLDRWKPRAFLTADPNEAAAQQVKTRLLKKYGTYLRAWKLSLDRTGDNRCTWDEFRDACKEVGWHDDVAGAWCALDVQRSGRLTLQDVDPTAGEALTEFRDWAVEQFGSVKTCFMVLDDDGSNEVTPFEFKQACRAYGFSGPAKLAFKALDTNNKGVLSADDVAFLDEWASRRLFSRVSKHQIHRKRPGL